MYFPILDSFFFSLVCRKNGTEWSSKQFPVPRSLQEGAKLMKCQSKLMAQRRWQSVCEEGEGARGMDVLTGVRLMNGARRPLRHGHEHDYGHALGHATRRGTWHAQKYQRQIDEAQSMQSRKQTRCALGLKVFPPSTSVKSTLPTGWGYSHQTLGEIQ